MCALLSFHTEVYLQHFLKALVSQSVFSLILPVFSLKREMRNLSEECNLEPVTVSMAYVYFEKLVLQGKLNKQNRKLCAGACVLLAAKISSDLRKHEVKHLIDVSTVRHVLGVVKTFLFHRTKQR